MVFQQSFFDPLLTAKENLEIRALLYNPEILVLDEPTAGLDPRSRRKVWEAINTLRTKDGRIVFLTTHYMEETELADSVLIIDRSVEVASGTPMELRVTHTPTVFTLRTNEPAKLNEGLTHYRLLIDADRLHLNVSVGLEVVSIAVGLDNILDLEIRHRSMDNVFLVVTTNLGSWERKNSLLSCSPGGI